MVAGRQTWAVVASCALLCSMNVARAAEEKTSPVGGVVGKVTVVRGTAQRSSSLEGPYEDLRRALEVRENDVVRTAADSRVELRLGDGSAIRLGPSAQMLLGKATGALSTAPSEVTLRSGALWAKMAKAVDGQPSFLVKTASAVAGVRGTTFVVFIIGGNTVVSVTEGAVAVNNGPALANLAGAAAAPTPNETLCNAGLATTVSADGAVAEPAAWADVIKGADKLLVDSLSDGTWEAAAAEGTESGPAEDGSDTGELKVRSDADNLSPQQMVGQSERKLAEMRSSLRTALELIAAARAQRDIVKLNCLNERVTQLKGVLKVAEDAHTSLVDQAAQGDVEGSRGSFTRVSMAHDRIKNLRVQAQNCVGADSYYGGNTEVITDVNPQLAGADPFFSDPSMSANPRDDVADNPSQTTQNTDNTVPQPPVCGSCYQ
jgi:hypothetical protein